jgi:hypothetical protein
MTEIVRVENSYLVEKFHGESETRMSDFENLNHGADFWRFKIGQNVFPADSKNKITREKWKENGWQNHPIPLEQHEKWKKERAFNMGFMVMPGTPWHRTDKIKLYLTSIEWDKQLGFDGLFEGKSLDEVRKRHFIEQHLDDIARGHLWVYSPIVFPKKIADNILGIEVKGLGSHGVIISSPCFHKNGHRIETIGLPEPVTWSKEQAFRMLMHLNAICRKYSVPYLDRNDNDNSSTSSFLSGKLIHMIKSLTVDPSVEIHDGQRHHTLISIANSILFRHSTTKSHDKLREFFMQINDCLCKPDPLPNNEISKIWEDALEFVSKIKEQEHQQKENSAEVAGRRDIVWIPADVKLELAKHKWALTRHSPQRFMIAHSRFNQIVEGSIESKEKEEQSGPSLKTYFLKYAKVLANAIPIEVTIYDDPINVTLEQRYKIKFRTSTEKIFASRGPSSLDGIVAELVDKALVYSAQEGKEALSRIVNAYENDGSIRISQEIESPGFYLIDGRIKAFRIEIRDHSQQELAEAAEFLNTLVERHNRKEIPATTIKWATVGPFDYVLKQYTRDLCWMPWLGLVGWPRSGKSTQGRIACGIWEDFYHGIKYNIPFTTVNTEARLGKKLSQSTLPTTINECDALNDDKNKNIQEMIKNCIETKVSRGKYETRTVYVDEPALSLSILTSNSSLPSELGFRSRIIYIVYTKDDKYWDSLGAKEFTAFILKGRQHLTVYGNFVARYILKNQQVLLKENIEDCNWKEAAESVLREFYIAAGKPIADWLTYLVDEKDVMEAAAQEANEISHFELRGFLEKAIIDGYRNDPLIETDSQNNKIGLAVNVELGRKLDRCLNQRLIPYLHKHRSRSGIFEVVITHDIIRELKRSRISNTLTMQALAREIPNFEYGPLKLNDGTARVVHGPYDDFVKFLNCDFNDEETI